MFIQSKYNKKGFTLIELLVTLVLSAAVIAVAARLFLSTGSITSISDYFTSQEVQTRYTAELINNAIKYTNALFTIPRSSFKEANLTESWSYLGVMDNVKIPNSLIREKEGAAVADTMGEFSATALVYIKYIGNEETISKNEISANLGADQSLIENENGYFVLTVFDYEKYNEKLGYKTVYELVFSTDNDAYISDAIKYSLKITYKDQDGKTVGEGSNLELETMLNGINMLQAVYQGSKDNPATAIAFHEDGFNVMLKNGGPRANIIFVLDVSTSMKWSIDKDSNPKRGEQSRIELLQENAKQFLDQFTMYGSVYVGFVQFSRMGVSSILPKPANDPNAGFYTYINNLHNNLSNYTNIGDGLRVAYSHFQYIEDNHLNDGATNFLILMTDGAANAWSAFTPNQYINTYGQYTAAKTNTILFPSSYAFPERFPTSSDCLDFFWSDDNITNYPDYLLCNEGSWTYYIPKSMTVPREGQGSFSSIASSGTYKLEKSGTPTQTFSYKPPASSNYPKQFNDFCAEKIMTASFKTPILKYFSISNFAGSEKQADEILNAFEIESARKKDHVFTIDSSQSFVSSITKLASDIQNAAWILDGPKT